ncbi:MAG: bifunctional adenosylcobinamide kinase/adenosylcobinamide-phosphate guanylyltransferase [Deltaproteobacteria bacterium]
MARIILITGGSRSGKSIYAQQIAESMAEDRTYIATCPVVDEEMEERIRKHREARRAGNWQTIEETTDLEAALTRAKGSAVILIDCLTLWVNNLMYQAELQKKDIREEDIVERCRDILDACGAISGTVIFVTNEIGMGIVPDNALSRRYRDLAGRCNQIMAGRADAVVFMVSGLPLNMKGEIRT